MRITVVGKEKENVEALKRRISHLRNFCQLDEKDPEVVVSLGGDGSLLVAERMFPGVPKLMLRDGSICKKCHEGEIEDFIEQLSDRSYSVEKYSKIEAEIIKKDGKRSLLATNDIVVSNQFPNQALRFSVEIPGKLKKEFIGDGIVVASSFGSTGYFHSITRDSFEEGIGVVFNNTTEKQETIFLDNEDVNVKILRNPAYVTSDNNEDLPIIDVGDRVRIFKSEKFFQVIKIND
jgi:NAD+ kinase